MNKHYYSRKSRKGVYQLISDYIRGVSVEFEVVSGLFSYKYIDEGTKLLLEYAEINEKGIVLDLGCGYGVIGITLAKLNSNLEVYMIDVNEDAVEIAKRNIIRNGLDPNRVKVLRGNLYEPVKNIQFNAIYTNPPLSAGMHVVEQIIKEAPTYLQKEGTLQIVVRRGSEKVYKLLTEVFRSEAIKKLASKRGYKVYLARKI